MGRRLLLASLVYGTMAMGALAWCLTAGDPSLWRAESPWLRLDRPSAIVVSVLAGLTLALVVVLASRVLVRRVGWARDLHVAFRGLLGPLSGTEIAFFALTSGVAEELFFRGAMQTSLGLWPTALIFGALHVGPSRRFLPWTLSALLIGLVFGILFAATGELIGVVVAHVLINYENLHFIDAFDPIRQQGRAVAPPSLVGRSLRADGRGPT